MKFVDKIRTLPVEELADLLIDISESGHSFFDETFCTKYCKQNEIYHRTVEVFGEEKEVRRSRCTLSGDCKYIADTTKDTAIRLLQSDTK